MSDTQKTPTFTPGPWQAYLPGRKFVQSVRNFNSICELNTFDRPPEVVDANARLIAAAPDLVAALLACGVVKPTTAPKAEGKRCWCRGLAAVQLCLDQPRCLAARAALLKAGEPP